jgi:hypothetical protein
VADRSFAALKAGFERASDHSDRLTSAAFDLAGHTIGVNAVGCALAESIARPLSHLGGSPGPQALTVDLWDAEETAVPSPLVSSREGPGAVTSSSDGRFLLHDRPEAVMALDREEQHLIGCFVSSSRLSQGDRARPLSLPLAVWCSDHDVQLIHAGLVAADGHGVLLAGLSGAGKSTAALACASAGFDFLGEDLVALTVSQGGDFTGHSVYNSSLLEPSHLSVFPPAPAGTVRGRSPEDEKAMLFLERAARAAPVRVLALPRIVSSANSRTPRATKGQALRTLAPSSLVKRAVPPRASLKRMAELVDRVPSYWLDMDRDLAAIPARVQRMLIAAGAQ